MGILIKNGTIVTDLDEGDADIRCCEGRIEAIGTELSPEPGDEVIDASSQYVFPGGIDPHVHMELPLMGTVSADDFESGTAAGVAGGTTSIIDFVIPDRGEDMMESLRARRELAENSVVDFGLHMAVTWWGDRTAEWMRRCVQEEGIPSFKTFMAYLETVGLGDAELIEVMKRAHELEALVTVHAEHGEMVKELQRRLIEAGRTEPKHHALSRPPEVEGEAASRAMMLAGLLDQPLYIVHVSCAQTVKALRRARGRGQKVIGETCAQYLLLDDSIYEQPGFGGAAAVMSPPIRPREHQEVLWEALGSGALDLVATDHCPFDLKGQKEMGREDFTAIPNGAAGIEHRLALLYTYGVLQGRLSLRRFVEVTSAWAARIFGLYPRKGSISVGADADLVVWDPEASGTISATTHHHRCDSNIFEGFETKGGPSTVIVGGKVGFQDGDLRVERGAGRFLSREL